MATYSTGLSASWDGTDFTEVFDLSVQLASGDRKDRASVASSTGWTDEAGTVSVSAYGVSNMDSFQFGARKPLVLSGGGVSLTVNAVCTGVSATPQLNGVTRYTFTAKLLDT